MSLFSSNRSVYQYLSLGAIIVCVLLFFTARPEHISLDNVRAATGFSSSVNSATDQVANATLGFEKIVVIGLPDRSDRRDGIVIQAALTDLEITFMDGVRGADIVDKALPNGVDRIALGENNLGSTRAHLNAIRSILEKRQASTLIIEDDVDWDLRIRKQMYALAEGVRTITNSVSANEHGSPYGDDWDVIWPGHCGDYIPDGSPVHTIPEDHTVAPLSQVGWLKPLVGYDEYTRVVYRSGGPICTLAYAVSNRGARKILLRLGLQEGFDETKGFKGSGRMAYDNNLAWMCESGMLKCVSVSPPLFASHRPAGPVDKDSDIQSFGGDGASRAKGTTEVIVWSVRVNAMHLIEEHDEKDYESSWPS